jgi:hypothetical protein
MNSAPPPPAPRLIYVYVKLKDRKRSLSEKKKTTTTRCGIRETSTTGNVALWLFLNNGNALWHVKICRHDAKVVSWLLKEMTNDLIHMQSERDGYYQFIMNYQDHLTKFTILRPRKNKMMYTDNLKIIYRCTY